ncbi:MAG: response regulator [Deltaproteobacteria bacterium]|nr:response regulator [Deltaproteobacteria bacterium]
MFKILVVDDEDSIRALYQAELEEDGYEVVCASDGSSALQALKQGDVHLVVLDIKLKGESGLQVLQEITRHHRQTPVILSTAYGSFKDDFSSWLADAYVVKSSNLQELKAEVVKVLNRRYGGSKPN